MRVPYLQTLAAVAIVALLAGCAAPATPTQSNAPATSPGATQPAGPTSATPALPKPSSAPNPYAIPSKTTQVPASGATFPKPLIEAWAIGFANDHPTVQVSYGGGGSGKGISDITAKNVVFAGSDAPLQPAEKDKAPGVLQFPETIGPVAIGYNLNGVSGGLHLTCDVLGKVYSGAIKKWNDEALKALNPGVNLPDASIAIVYRSDSSGTTFVFTDYLTHCSPAWSAAMGPAASKKPTWTQSSAQQLSGAGNDGVASTVKQTPNSIGYMDLAFAANLGIRTADMQNKAGEFVSPSVSGASLAAKAAAANLPKPDGDWSKVSIVDGEGKGVYPISTFTYILMYDTAARYEGKFSQDQINAAKAFLFWATHEGQAYAEPLFYAPLPSEVVQLDAAALASMT